ncbi:MAG: MazG family protein [Acidimicrobiaceae bacterium]|nr:MazG family protein [Acidimicrobiaceae bacterium]MYD06200.1 MazG family protein [Acidimicrobiaceae bacterium]MYI57446.1 MazG family protein [Acidimicrobiaceae bacterium]
MGTITVVGLGPADEELLTAQTRAAIAAAPRCFLRTRMHPAARVLSDAVAFDDEYEKGESFEAVYEAISERLILESAEGDLLYAVPGSPLVLERTVELLRDAAQSGRVTVEILAAMSFLDVAWARLGIDPVTDGTRLVDGQDFAFAAAGQTGPLLVAHCHARQVLSDIKLSVEDGPESVVVLQRLGLPDESVFEVAWDDLDRQVEPDHLTSLWIPELDTPVAAEFVRFEELVRELRERCPWDRVQTHGSLRKHLLEETYEALEALDARSELDDSEVEAELDAHLVEELGDLLYQIFFHARLGAERGSFTVADVARSVYDKLVARHPHVFGDGAVDGVRGPEDADDMARRWEEIKRDEKGRASTMDGVPMTLPALMLAAKVQERSEGVGLGVDRGGQAGVDGIGDALGTAGANPSVESVGEILFETVAFARQLDIDPETALRGASIRFMKQIRATER